VLPATGEVPEARPAAPATAGAPASQVSGTLASRQSWVAYTFRYPGDDSKVGILATYDTADDPYTDNSFVVAVYSPESTPPGGKPMGEAAEIDTNPNSTADDDDANGEKYFQIQSGVSGTYHVIVQNWTGLEKPIHYTLRTVAVNDDDGEASVRGDPNGPELTLVGTRN
jgi:hypothetical protein